MPRVFKIGDLVKITRKTRARDQYGQPIKSGNIIDPFSKARIVSYNDKYTETSSDDILKLKITSGDPRLKGKEVWVRSGDFKKLDKVY